MFYEQFIRLADFMRCCEYGQKLVKTYSFDSFFGLAGDHSKPHTDVPLPQEKSGEETSVNRRR